MKIYHNNRCSKSRETLNILKNYTNEFKIIEYIKNPLQFNEYKTLIKLLNIKPIEIIRKNEKIWKEKYQGKKLNDDEIINILVKFPILMERPIVCNNGKAIIGRPPKNILKLFN